MTSHQAHCAYIKDEVAVGILPANLINYKKCVRCQPPIIPESKQQFVTMAIISSD